MKGNKGTECMQILIYFINIENKTEETDKLVLARITF